MALVFWGLHPAGTIGALALTLAPGRRPVAAPVESSAIRGHRLLLRAVAALVAVLASGCQVTLTTGVDMSADGTGVVRAAVGLDGEALRQLGDPAAELRLDDLRQAGWEVEGPAKEDDGLTWVRVWKHFATAEDAGRVAAELSGPEGPFREFRVERTRSFLKTKTHFTGLVDLSKGLLAGLAHPAIGQAIGGDAEALRARYGEAVDQAVRVRVESRLPGRTESWEPKVGDQLRVESRAEAWNREPLFAGLAALLFAATALVLVAVRRH